MSETVIVGSVSEATCFEWRIPDFFKLGADEGQYYRSPVFPFSGCTWYLRLYVKLRMADETVSLCPIKNGSGGDVVKSVTCILGIKKTDGTLEEEKSSTKTFKKNDFNLGYLYFLRPKDLKRRKSELAPSDTLTFTCRMEGNVPGGQPVEVVSGPSEITGLQTLSKNFNDLFTSGKKCDVTVRVKDVEFQTHKAVLVARSAVFAAMFEHDTSEEETGVVTVPDCDPDSFGDFLQYLYTGKFEGVSSKNANHLYITADKYDVQELKSFCVAHMMRNLNTQNVCDVVTLADQYDETGLLSSAQNFFNQNFSKIISTAEWRRLLKRDCLLANTLLERMAPKVEIKE